MNPILIQHNYSIQIFGRSLSDIRGEETRFQDMYGHAKVFEFVPVRRRMNVTDRMRVDRLLPNDVSVGLECVFRYAVRTDGRSRCSSADARDHHYAALLLLHQRLERLAHSDHSERVHVHRLQTTNAVMLSYCPKNTMTSLTFW